MSLQWSEDLQITVHLEQPKQHRDMIDRRFTTHPTRKGCQIGTGDGSSFCPHTASNEISCTAMLASLGCGMRYMYIGSAASSACRLHHSFPPHLRLKPMTTPFDELSRTQTHCATTCNHQRDLSNLLFPLQPLIARHTKQTILACSRHTDQTTPDILYGN